MRLEVKRCIFIDRIRVLRWIYMYILYVWLDIMCTDIPTYTYMNVSIPYETW